MCGIVGYVGGQEAAPLLIEGLRRLEYRGYDSAGLAVYAGNSTISIRRAMGKLLKLEELLNISPVTGNYGIAHTRWATHGKPSERNSHPHRDCSGKFVVVHNGIVENYLSLKESLESDGHKFETETDTEVISHLVEKYFTGCLEKAVRRAVSDIRGVFAISVVSSLDPGKIVVVREGPPVVLGIGKGETFVASDIPAILPYTRSVVFLADGDFAVLTKEGATITDSAGRQMDRQIHDIHWDPLQAERGGYRHFMLKEIDEQPRAIRETISGRFDVDAGNVLLEGMKITRAQFRAFREVRLIACGTSWHAALAGRFMIEKLARVPVHVDYGSEFRYRDPIISPDVLTVVVSQSGETADTLAAQRESKRKGATSLAICNVFGSMITREAAGTIYTQAGPEIGVASTKAFTCQLTTLLVLALYLGRLRGTVRAGDAQQLMRAMARLPEQAEAVLSQAPQIAHLSGKYQNAKNALYLGRGIHFPIALEGALKLKEISYIHAEGYPSGEMKHGPNALIDDQMPVVVLATYNPESPDSCLLHEKTMSNIQEVRAREGRVIVIANEGDCRFQGIAEDVITIPAVPDLLAPILEVLPLQLFAYHIAVRRGCDVDQPRNLAKSVTVE